MIGRMKGKEERDPAFSVVVAALCGRPHTDTPANESDLVSTRQKIYVSVLARTKHTSINI